MGGHGPLLEFEICRKCFEILRLSEKLVDHQQKSIRFTMMTTSVLGQAILVFIHVVRPARILL